MRSRIVISLDNPSGKTAAKPRQVRVPATRRHNAAGLLIVIAVVLVIFAGGVVVGVYSWWQHFKAGPVYSLALLADAAQRNDTATVDSILDTDRIVDNFVSQVRQRGLGSYSLAIGSTLPVQLNSSVPALPPKLRQTVHDELVKQLRQLTAPAAGKPFALVALAFSRLADVKQQSDAAHALINIKNQPAQLTMELDNGRWRLVSVKHDKLALQIADSVLRDWSPGTQTQPEMRKQPNKPRKRSFGAPLLYR